MDEEPPIGMLTSQVYKGPATIPHASGDFFAAFFLATNVRLVAACGAAVETESGRKAAAAYLLLRPSLSCKP